MRHGLIREGLEPTDEQLSGAARDLLNGALRPIADSPEFRQQAVEIHRTHEQLIDETSKDALIDMGYSKDATDRARATVESFRQSSETAA